MSLRIGEKAQLIEMSWAGPEKTFGFRFGRFFYFFIFYFRFFTKIYFRFGNLQKYIPAAPLSGGRDLAARRQGLKCKKKKKKNYRQVPGAGRPAAGRTAPLAARQRGGRPPATLYKVFAPSPPFGLLKIQKKRREREGEEG